MATALLALLLVGAAPAPGLADGSSFSVPPVGRSGVPSSDGPAGLLAAARAPIARALESDSLVEQTKLTAREETFGEWFGYSVALSADGATAAIGGPHDSDEAGAVWVFVRSGATWTQQAKLTVGAATAATAAIGGGGGDQEEEDSRGRLGASLALSADGNIAVIGDPGDEAGIGAAWVFTRSGTAWTRQAKLTGGSEEQGEGRFGRGVGLSSDGNTAFIGAPRDGAGIGAAWVFTRSGATWTRVAAKLTGGEELGEGHFGVSIALAADGATALIGGPGDGGYAGAAWVFARSGTATWIQQGPKLTGGEEEQGEGHFGRALALAADGATALIGAPNDHAHIGAAWVFARSGTTWTQQGSVLTGAGESGAGEFGYSVALSSDANTALIGAPEDKGGGSVGAAWVFARSSATWTQQGQRLKASGANGNALFGYSVALSSDAGTALIGGLRASTRVAGAAWVFAAEQLSASPPPEVVGGLPNESARGSGVTATGGVLAFGPTTVAASAACRVSLLGRNVTVRSSGRMTLKFTSRSTHTCSGRLKLITETTAIITKAKVKQRSKRTTIGIGTFSIPAGKTSTVKLELNVAGRLLLSMAHGRLPVSMVMLEAVAPSRTDTVQLVLRKARQSQKRR
ncbi:MAG TPA: hypothetical protein VNY27_02370 [Solirubrobacteraceae bacterium]|nr:hypothetical protein [Solirubrobacteraceae bacterium]